MNEARGELTLPKILDWFAKDFGGAEDKVVAFIARYRPAEAARLRSRRWRIRYFEYDWSPNDISAARSPGRAAN
jgi:hypothetical protein